MSATSNRSVQCLLLLSIICVTTALHNGSYVLYEEDENGDVLINTFAQREPIMNVVPILGTFNPSPRMAGCSKLGPGRFPVHGNCSRYLECLEVGPSDEKEFFSTKYETNITPRKYRRLIIECPLGLWFSFDEQGCTFPEYESCPYGRLVPNPIQGLSTSVSPLNSRCMREGVFISPGCRGYFTCHIEPNSNQFSFYSYECFAGTKWSEDDLLCLPDNMVICDIAEVDNTCTRTCVAGETRTCRYTFIVEEFASMSIYCRNCPLTPEDCSLPGCIPTGGVSKPVVAINRQVPGPTIQACKGDMLEIEVQNRLANGVVTIHWHGLHQRATPFMDGVPYMTQCPILPGTAFRYRMVADVSGTHMYHSHAGHQESDGVFGSMIIREPPALDPVSNRYDEDQPEHRLLIWHWFSRMADVESIDTRLQSLRRAGFSFIINGKGATIPTYRRGNPVFTPVETFRVVTGRRYRFRSIFNSPLNCPVQVSIDSHNLEIIATDGRPVVVSSGLVDSFILSAGERTDFVPRPLWNVRTNNQSFYIRLRGLNDCDNTRNGVHQHAILRYDGSTGTPVGSPPAYANAIRSGAAFNLPENLRNDNNYVITGRALTSAQDSIAVAADNRIRGTPNKIFYVDVRFNAFTNSEQIQTVYPQLNNITYANPSFSPLTQPESITPGTFCRPGAPRNCVNGLCQCPQVLEAQLGDLVEVVLIDPVGSGIGHPFHLHGYAFRVVSMFQSTTPLTFTGVRELNEQGRINKSFMGPLKDTVIVPGRGYVVFRFVADNPGFWLFHCHISEHMAAGMALFFQVGTTSQMVKAPHGFPKCGNFF